MPQEETDMKAIRVRAFGPPEVMRLEEVPDPAPGPGQVLVCIRAAGVNPVETYIRSGAYARRPALPYTPGHDAAGIVEALKENGLEIEILGFDVLDEIGKEALAEAGIRTVSASVALHEARRTKTQDEITCIKMAVALADVGFSRAFQVMRVGVKENEVLAQITQASHKRDATARKRGCHICGNSHVWRRVGPRFYCEAHTAEAFAEAKRTGLR